MSEVSEVRRRGKNFQLSATAFVTRKYYRENAGKLRLKGMNIDIKEVRIIL